MRRVTSGASGRPPDVEDLVALAVEDQLGPLDVHAAGACPSSSRCCCDCAAAPLLLRVVAVVVVLLLRGEGRGGRNGESGARVQRRRGARCGGAQGSSAGCGLTSARHRAGAGCTEPAQHNRCFLFRAIDQQWPKVGAVGDRSDRPARIATCVDAEARSIDDERLL
jgi:hypothetical protein